MNWYLIAAGIIAAVSTPLGVHIGYLMAYNQWPFFLLEMGLLTIIHMVSPIIWIRAQTNDINLVKKKND